MKSSKKDSYFEKLESRMVKYRDLLSIAVKDNHEYFVYLDSKTIPNKYAKGMDDVKKIFGPRILVRKSVYVRIKNAQNNLKKINKNYSLLVTYGYRSLERQTDRFLWQLGEKSNMFFEDPVELYEAVHRNVAVPAVAGHPTGGAIDIVIIDLSTNDVLDFGSSQYDYSTKNTYVFTNQISEKQKANRMLLRKILLEVGFAPFDGEWWHFSYGDKEWAFYYKRQNAIYGQISSDKVKIK